MVIQHLILTPKNWNRLESLLNHRQAKKSLTCNIITYLKTLGAQSVIIESEHLDEDFNASYINSCMGYFHRNLQFCTRMLFFSERLTSIFRIKDIGIRVRELERRGTSAFLGYIVIRPVNASPIAQVVLSSPHRVDSTELAISIGAPITVHFLGAKFRISAVPMTQHDQRISSCAQTSVWACLRYFYYKLQGSWVSMMAINEAALKGSTWESSRAIPNGSEGLTVSELVAAIRGLGYQPLTYAPDEQFPQITWNSVRPHEIISKYIDSELPVIVGLLNPQSGTGHTVVATGQILGSSQAHLKPGMTRAKFLNLLLVNDDHLGFNLRMSMEPETIGETPYDYNNISFLVIGLPREVILSAENAEKIAWRIVSDYRLKWLNHVKSFSNESGSSIRIARDFISSLSAGNIVARTYLTCGWEYKERIAENTLNEEAKRAALSLALPRFVWVTEFGTMNSFCHSTYSDQRIFSHCVLDATVKNVDAAGQLFFHAPGFFEVPNYKSRTLEHAGSYSYKRNYLADDTVYYPK